ncbi:MAG: transcription termination factor NusA [Candidatus Hydrogenedentota bacterium]
METAFVSALKELEEEKGVPQNILIDIIEEAILKAYKKNYGETDNVKVEFDKKKGNIRIFSTRRVVENLIDKQYEISFEEAKNYKKSVKIDDFIELEIKPKDFNRIAALTVKNVFQQELRRAEKGMIYDEFKNKQGELVNARIQRISKGNVFLTIGRVEALLPKKEQMPNDTYVPEQRIRVIILEVKELTKGSQAQVIVSRTHSDLVRRLFESEVPEIADNTLEIKEIAREAGYRTKVAIKSTKQEIDPIGTCVGQRGTRIQTIMRELNGEKIDIIKWDENINNFIINALSPAPVITIEINEAEKEASVIVPQDKQSLAIGKAGQNVRLAAKLTGWKIDIKSDAEIKKKAAFSEFDAIQGIQRAFEDTAVKDLDGIGEKTLQKLIASGYTIVRNLLDKTPEDLAKIDGIGLKSAEKILKAVLKLKEKADLEKEKVIKELKEKEKVKEPKEEKKEPEKKELEIESFIFEDGKEAANIEELKELSLSLSLDELKGYVERGDFDAWLSYAGYNKKEISKFMKEINKKMEKQI